MKQAVKNLYDARNKLLEEKAALEKVVDIWKERALKAEAELRDFKELAKIPPGRKL